MENWENYNFNQTQENASKNKLSKKAILIISAILILAIVFSGVIGYYIAMSTNNLVADNEYDLIQKFKNYDLEMLGQFDLLIKSLSYAKNNYYKDLSLDELDKIAALSVMNGIDDFTSMYNPNDLITNGILSVGIGIRISSNMYNEHTITHIYNKQGTNTPSQAELKIGDMIYAVDGQRVSGLPSNYLAYFTIGGIGTNYTLTVIRNGNVVDIDIEKCLYEAKQSIYISTLGGGISNDIGYINLMSFTGDNTVSEFESCIQSFKNDNKKALILDLRNNGGGSSVILSDVASYLVQDKSNIENKQVPLIEFYNNSKSTNSIIKSTDSSKYLNVPVYVLTNEGTASSSEALISAMLYYNGDTTVVIGKNTYGKGVGQITSYIQDNDGVEYAITMVSGYYYVYTNNLEDYPSGKYTLHEIGIAPNIFVKPQDEYPINYYEDTFIIEANKQYLKLS